MSAVSDPTGPTMGTDRLNRGGCWLYQAANRLPGSGSWASERLLSARSPKPIAQCESASNKPQLGSFRDGRLVDKYLACIKRQASTIDLYSAGLANSTAIAQSLSCVGRPSKIRDSARS